MSVEDEISDILRIAQGVQESEIASALELTVGEGKALLKMTNISLHDVCAKIEAASTKQELLVAFRTFDRIMRFFLSVPEYKNHKQLVVQAVISLTVSTRFQGMLESTPSLVEAVTSYKTLVTKDLAVRLRIQNEQASRDAQSRRYLMGG